MKQTKESSREIAGVLIGMAASVLLIERWSDAGIAAACFALIVFCVYPIRLRALLARLVPFLVFAVITFAFGSLGQGTGRLSLGAIGIGEEALSQAGLAAVRLILLGVAAVWIGLYVGATRMISLLVGLGRAGRRIGLDFTVLFLAMGVAIRFLPLMQEESRRLQLAWQARGAGLAAHGPGRRIRYATALTVPLMAAALRRAEALAEAIEVRLGGSSFQGADLWHAGAPAQSGSAPVGARRRRAWVGVMAAWFVVAVRVWRWVG